MTLDRSGNLLTQPTAENFSASEMQMHPILPVGIRESWLPGGIPIKHAPGLKEFLDFLKRRLFAGQAVGII